MARINIRVGDESLHLTLRAMMQAAGHQVEEGIPDLYIVDDAMDAIRFARERPTLVLAALNQLRSAIAAMRQGVYGYVLLPLQPGEAPIMVERALQLSVVKEKPLRRLETIEFEYIQETLRRCKNNRAEAARVLGIGRNTLWRKLRKGGGAGGPS